MVKGSVVEFLGVDDTCLINELSIGSAHFEFLKVSLIIVAIWVDSLDMTGFWQERQAYPAGAVCSG